MGHGLKIVVSALMLSVALFVQAAPVKYVYSGTVSNTQDYLGTTNVGQIVPNGTPIIGSFHYDPDAPFSYFIEPDRALFAGPSEPSSVSVGPLRISGSSGEVQLFDNYGGSQDMLFLPSVDSTLQDLPVTMQGYTAVIRLQFYGPVENMALPRQIDLQSYGLGYSITGYSSAAPPPGYFAWNIGGYITSLRLADVPQMLGELATNVNGVGPGKRLLSKISNAQTYYEANDTQATCVVLYDFIQTVDSLAGSKKLPSDQAAPIRLEAGEIIEAIGCD